MSTTTHFNLPNKPHGVVPHLDGAGQLSSDSHAQNHTVGESGEYATEVNTTAEGMRHDCGHNHKDG